MNDFFGGDNANNGMNFNSNNLNQREFSENTFNQNSGFNQNNNFNQNSGFNQNNNFKQNNNQNRNNGPNLNSNFGPNNGFNSNNQPRNGPNVNNRQNQTNRRGNYNGNQGNTGYSQSGIRGAFSGIKNGIGLDRKIGFNEILISPISALYKFIMKIQKGFKLDEEVRTVVKIQVLYLILGLISGKSVYLVLTIGNIISMVFVLILASSYVNLPDYLTPGGMVNGISNKMSKNNNYDEEYNNQYNEQYNNQYYEQYNNQYNDPEQNTENSNNRQYDINNNPNNNQFGMFDPNISDNNQINFNKSNLEPTSPGEETERYSRDQRINNMGNDMYNNYCPDVNPFNTAGLNTEKNPEREVNFGFDNLSGIPKDMEIENKFDEIKEDKDTRFNFKNAYERSLNTEFKPSLENIYRNPSKSRQEIFRNNPIKDKIATDRSKINDQIRNMSPPVNKPMKENIIQKGSKNFLNMIKDGYLVSMSNSNLTKQDEGFELL